MGIIENLIVIVKIMDAVAGDLSAMREEEKNSFTMPELYTVQSTVSTCTDEDNPGFFPPILGCFGQFYAIWN